MNWTRRNFLASTAAFPLLAEKNAPGPRPNVVLIAAEELGAWMIGCYGNLEIKTPNIDRLASSGVRFHNHFVTTPAASASRATLLTGRIPRQHGIADYLTPQPAQNPSRGQATPPASFATEVLLSDVLSSAGYRCGHAGRWEFGSEDHPGHGFSFNSGLDASLQAASGAASGAAAEAVTRRAEEFLDQQSAASPFLLVVSFPKLNGAQGLAPRFTDIYRTTAFQTLGIQPASALALEGRGMLTDPIASIRAAAAAVSALDEQVGAIQKKIIQKGLLENTLIIFTSVTGQFLGRHGLWGAGYASNPPTMLDEAIRTPLILSWPGRFPTQLSRAELVSTVDLLPTLCDALGLSTPSGRNLSGRSYLMLALGKPLPKHRVWTDLVFGELREIDMARDNRFKLILRPEGQGADELYDLRQDPNERVNQFANQAFVDVRTRLTGELRAWHEKYTA